MATMLHRAKEIRGALLEAVERIANPHGLRVELRQIGPVKRLNLFLLSLLVLPYSTLAYATVDATGSFSGTISSVETACNSQTPKPTNNESATFTFTQSGTTYSGSGSVGASSITNITGNISATGSITGSSFNIIDTTNGTASFSGTLSGNTLTLSGTWQDNGYPGTAGTCTGTFSGTLTRGGAIVSASSPSSTATASVLLNTQVNAVTTAIGTRIGDALRGVASGPRKIASGFMWEGQSGLSAGDGLMNYGVWGSYSYSDFKNSLSSTALKGNRHNLLAGVDYSPWENTVLGVAVGYDRSDVDTAFNQGNQISTGKTIAVYAGHVLDKTWSIDASGGYSDVSDSQFRIAPASTVRVSSSPSGNRLFANLNLNATTHWQNWVFGARTGLLYARSLQKSFTESNGTAISQSITKLGQFSIGGDAAYSYAKYEPFVKLFYQNDYSMQKLQVATGPQPSNDNDDFLFGLGLRYFGAKGLTGNLEFNKRLGRTHFSENTLTATMRMDF
ncbi:MAG: autotransporter outer membrane beta-barrel domain-containing protein [Polynucleobacter sp.]|nr:autotransporter outer membrane beta-barrel domain-containing protein [Polynucleobacter sp.]